MRRGGRTLASFASAVGVEKFWVSFPLPVQDANHGMPIPFASTLLETALQDGLFEMVRDVWEDVSEGQTPLEKCQAKIRWLHQYLS
jgi:hypothetical protein